MSRTASKLAPLIALVCTGAALLFPAAASAQAVAILEDIAGGAGKHEAFDEQLHDQPCSETNPERQLSLSRDQERLQAALADLPAEQREVFLLRAHGELTRRWERDGWWTRSALNLVFLTLYELGAAPAWLVKRYHRTYDADQKGT